MGLLGRGGGRGGRWWLIFRGGVGVRGAGRGDEDG